MPISIKVHQRVLAYQRTLHPDARRALKVAILALPKGDTKPLTDEYEGFHRLRVGHHRVIYQHSPGGIKCFYAAPRATVYEYLAAHLKELLD